MLYNIIVQFVLEMYSPLFGFQRVSLIRIVLYVTAQNAEEREQWVHALESCIRRLLQPVRVSWVLCLVTHLVCNMYLC